MSKQLTEQWRDGTLEENMYYVKLPEEIIIANIYQLKQLDLVNDADEIEVLAAVPDYNKYKQLVSKTYKLKKRLKIAKKALDDILNDGDDYWDKDKAQEAIKEIDLGGTSTKGE